MDQPDSDDQPTSWPVGSSSSDGHSDYHPGTEEEPSSSISSSSLSTTRNYVAVSSSSFGQSAYRTHIASYHNNHVHGNFAGEHFEVSRPALNLSSTMAVNHTLYQPAESSYDGQQDSNHDMAYSDVNSGNEAQVQMYEGNAIEDESFLGASTDQDASSSVSQSTGDSYPVHQLLVDAHNRIVALQRVISTDVDSTVSQSGSGMASTERDITNSDNRLSIGRSRLLQPSVSRSFTLSSALPLYSQSEVTTSAGSPMIVRGHCHRDRDTPQGHGEVEVMQGVRGGEDGMESAVSSISGSVQDDVEEALQVPLKVGRHALDDAECGEPDTTQEDEDEYKPTFAAGRGFVQDCSSIDSQDRLNSQIIVIETMPGPSASRSLADSVMDSDQLSSPENMSLHHVPAPVTEDSINTPVVHHFRSSMSAAINHMPALVSGNQMAVASFGANLMPVHLNNSYVEHIQMSAQNHVPAAMMTCENSTANILSSTTAIAPNIDPQISQTQYHLDTQNVDTSSRIPATDVKYSFVEKMDIATNHLDSTSLDQPRPGTSSQRSNRRKSNRIAELETDLPELRICKYERRPYDPNHLWCDECMKSYESECPTHKLVQILDKVVFSRAWASLPQSLQIFRLGESEQNAELGVFAKRSVTKLTQFGPFVADLVNSRAQITNSKFPLMVEQPDGEVMFYETTDENKCNWMMFVRPADNFAEQNLVAYQHGQDIYFSVTKNIDVKTELKVWYAPHYAERWGMATLQVTQADLQAIEERLCKFQCYECPKRFRTAAVLQTHLSAHDDPVMPSTSNDTSVSEPEQADRPKKRRSFANAGIRKKLLEAKKMKEANIPESSGSAGIYHWKKRSTNIYLNKTLKKYQKRHDAEVMRRSRQSQQRADDNQQDLICGTCGVIFDTLAILDLHIFSHTMIYSETDENLVKEKQEGWDQAQHVCPACQKSFFIKQDLVLHVLSHAIGQVNQDEIKTEPKDGLNYAKCTQCHKVFSNWDRLQKHLLSHSGDDQKPLQCEICFKRLMNNSALACHMKIHSTAKYYQCPICHIGFDQTSAMREHSLIHTNAFGSFNCPYCNKIFVEFLVLKKHVRGFHSNNTFSCQICEKNFPRPDKLRLHMLRHSSIREFMCDTCGHQFKRKDKLKEHIKRMHSSEREERDRLKAMKPPCRRFVPKVSPTEYHRFIYKCHLCLLGFKRRGMLVNHIAKRHPDIKPESVPELNLPILKTQRDYYCQYCDKVYKSSSKRKAHILKNHPGSELPQSARKKSGLDEIPGVPNPTYSQTVGSITTMPHQCEYCHKQYASKAKLLQHQRKKHAGMVPPLSDKSRHIAQHIGQDVAQHGTIILERYEDGSQPADSVQAADLLTQAMSELTQSFEFRQINTNQAESHYLTSRLVQGTPTMVQIQTPGSSTGTSTIELAHLSQALQHFAPSQGHLPIQVQVSTGGGNQIQIPILANRASINGAGTHIVTVDSSQDIPQSTSQGQQQISFQPINIISGTYIPKSWTNYT